MTDQEIYEELVEQTKDFVYRPSKKIDTLSDLCFLLSHIQVSNQVLEQIEYEKNKAEFRRLFCGYDPKKIIKNGKYVVQLNRVLEVFKPTRKTPYKDYVQAVMASSKYFSKQASFESYRKEIYLLCSNQDKTFQFLSDFRKKSSISEMFFVKSCLFFSESGLFDIPVLSKKAKAFFLPRFNLPDENEKLYFRLIQFAKKNNISCNELNKRVDSLA